MKAKPIKPHYNPKFRQYEISWNNEDGYGAVWGDTEEECLEKYNKLTKL